MTLLIATVGDGFTMLSQDSGVFPGGLNAGGGISADAAAAAESAFIGDGTPPTVEPIAFATKITALAHLNVVIGVTGAMMPARRYMDTLTWMTKARGISDLDDMTPEALGNVWRHELGPLTIVILGQSRGFAYASPDFASVPLVRGHSLSPIVDAGPGYDEICSLWERALGCAEAARRFHQLVAKNQCASYQAGRFAPNVGVRGPLVTALVSGAGVSMRSDPSI